MNSAIVFNSCIQNGFVDAWRLKTLIIGSFTFFSKKQQQVIEKVSRPWYTLDPLEKVRLINLKQCKWLQLSCSYIISFNFT